MEKSMEEKYTHSMKKSHYEIIYIECQQNVEDYRIHYVMI